MDEKRWRALERLFEQAISLGPGSRTTFVKRRCGSDPEMARELLELLANDAPASESLPPARRRRQRDAEPREPERLGRFRLDQIIGKGSKAVVYKGFDESASRAVTIKRLAADLPAGQVERYADEARRAAAIGHYHIAAFGGVYGRAGGERLAVSDWYGGETLASRLQSEPLEMKPAIATAQAVASALASAHRRKLVHRRVTPRNILITDRREIKLLDFGAWHLGAPTPAEAGTPWACNTPRAPESSNPAEPDAPADIWAVGALLHLLLLGREPPSPCVRRGHDARGAGIDETNPRWKALPHKIRALMQQALDEDPSRRRASMTHLCRDLVAVTMMLEFPGDERQDEAETVGAVLPARLLTLVESALRDQIGPVAAILVERHARTVPTFNDLVRVLAQELEDATSRRAFEVACQATRTMESPGKD